MAGVTLGFLKYVLGLDTLSFRKGISQADADLVKLQRSFATRGRELQSLGKTMTIGVTAPLIAFATLGVHEAQKMADAMGQVNAALKSTSGAAGVTADQLKKAAEGFEAHSLFESEDILRDLSSRLLAFGNINGQTFMRAQQVIVDFATRTKRDLGDATTVIGKALADPAKAEGALRRAGVVLTEGQKELIKQFLATGNAAAAQNVVLTALESKYKGAAQAAQNTDPFNKLHDAFKNMAEVIGDAIMPLLRTDGPLVNGITALAAAFTSLSPGTQKWLVILGAVAAVTGPFLVVLGNFVLVISKVGPAVSLLAGAFELLQAGFLIAKVAALEALPALLPYLVPLAAIALAVGAVYLAWKNWDKITAFVKEVYTAAKTWLVDKLNAVWDWLKGKIDAVIGFFKNMWDKVVGHSYVPDMVEQIGQEMAKLDDLMARPAAEATSKTAQAFADLQSRLKSLLDELFPEIAAGNEFLAKLKLLKDNADKAGMSVGALQEAIRRLEDAHFGGSSQPSIATDEGANTPLNAGAVSSAIAAADTALPKVISMTQEWGAAFSDIASGGLKMVVQGLGAAATGQAKLGDVFTKTMQRMTAALVEFIAEMAILEAVKAAFGQNSSVANFVSQAFGFGGGRASGGPVMAGTAYMVGESGRELFVPSSSGMIIPNSSLGSMPASGIINIYQTIAPRFDGNAPTREEVYRIAQLTKAAAVGAVREERRRRS